MNDFCAKRTNSEFCNSLTYRCALDLFATVTELRHIFDVPLFAVHLSHSAAHGSAVNVTMCFAQRQVFDLSCRCDLDFLRLRQNDGTSTTHLRHICDVRIRGLVYHTGPLFLDELVVVGEMKLGFVVEYHCDVAVLNFASHKHNLGVGIFLVEEHENLAGDHACGHLA